GRARIAQVALDLVEVGAGSRQPGLGLADVSNVAAAEFRAPLHQAQRLFMGADILFRVGDTLGMALNVEEHLRRVERRYLTLVLDPLTGGGNALLLALDLGIGLETV